ncbi:uncharacterized protein LOC127257633 [Andrographis paniculata]|uniref:uncharacterized protein LOC127257633 n=1 Tax=Andrographis paniculata TaxID=175694 RepID=UPI0021E74F4E|nr:uncharacterized protein LOC127257633 [Andrographis paniculata]
MPISDMLVDCTVGYEIFSFMDGYSGYNQIYLAKEDAHKIAFRCPGAIGIFEWIVMPFGLKNAGATYQRVMNAIFHDLIGACMEVYIDGVVVKSQAFNHHLLDLRNAFIRMRQHDLKINPANTTGAAGAGVVISSSKGEVGRFSHQLSQGVTNNQAEYEALLLALRFLVARDVKKVVIQGDSQLVIQQALKEFKLKEPQLQDLLQETHDLLRQLIDVTLEDIPREANVEAHNLAQWASGFKKEKYCKGSNVCRLPKAQIGEPYCWKV